MIIINYCFKIYCKLILWILFKLIFLLYFYFWIKITNNVYLIFNYCYYTKTNAKVIITFKPFSLIPFELIRSFWYFRFNSVSYALYLNNCYY